MDIVSGALLRDGRLLIGQRWPHKVACWSNMWELAGGKVEPGESDPDALAREWNEEYGLRKICIPYPKPIHIQTCPMPENADFEGSTYEVRTYIVESDDCPILFVHQAIKWATKADVAQLPRLSTLVSILERSDIILPDWK